MSPKIDLATDPVARQFSEDLLAAKTAPSEVGIAAAQEEVWIPVAPPSGGEETPGFGKNLIKGVDFGLTKAPKIGALELFGQSERADAIQNKFNLENPNLGGAGFGIGQAVGGLLPTVGAIAAAAVSAPVAATTGGVVLAGHALQAAGFQRKRIRLQEEETGEDISTAREAASVIGVTVATVLAERLQLKFLGKAIGAASPGTLTKFGARIKAGNVSGAAKGLLKDFKVAGLVTGAQEGIEEVVEQAMVNTINKILIDKDQKLTEGLGQALLFGGVAGGALGPLTASVRSIRTSPETKAELSLLATEGVTDDLMPFVQGLRRVVTPEDARVVSAKEFSAAQGTKIMLEQGDLSAGFVTGFGNVATQVDVDVVLEAIESPLGEKSAPLTQRLELAMNEGTKSPEANRILSDFREYIGNMTTAITQIGHKLPNVRLFDEAVSEGEESAGYRGDTDAVEFATPEAVKESLTEKIFNKSKDMKNAFTDKIDIKSAFTHAGAPRTGRAIQNMFSVQTAIDEEGFQTYKQIKAHENFREGDDARVILTFEDKAELALLSDAEQARLKPLHKLLGDFLEGSLGQLKSNKVLKQGYLENLRDRIDLETSKQNAFLVKAKTAKRKKRVAELNESIDELGKLRERLPDLAFAPISMAWFTESTIQNPTQVAKRFNFSTKRQRRTSKEGKFTIGDIIRDEGSSLQESDLSLTTLLASYARRVGRDLSLANIRKEALSEGMIKAVETSGKKKIIDTDGGFVSLEGSGPAFSDLQGSSYFKGWLNELSTYSRRPNIVARALNTAKMLQFINPTFLGMYDLVQASMAGAINVLRPVKTTKNFINAYKDVTGFTAERRASLLNGLESSIFAESWGSQEAMYELAGESLWKKGYALLLKDIQLKSPSDAAKLAPKLLFNIYQASFSTAWKLDSYVRQVTYQHLRSEGKGPKEAAQTAALYHGDYASVPPKTRQTLNLAFFTPTFKIVMGGLYANLIKNTIQAATVSEKAAPDAIRGIESIGRIIVIMGGIDLLMSSLGFEREEFGREYMKEISTKEGPKEQVIVFAGPHLLATKYIGKLLDTTDPLRKAPYASFLQSFKWDLNPVWRIASDIIAEEKRPTGKIFNKNDPSALDNAAPVKELKTLLYATKQVIALTRAFKEEPDIEESRELFANEVGQLFSAITKPFSFVYERDPKIVRSMRRIDELRADLTTVDPAKPKTEAELRHTVRKIERILREFNRTNK